jgi:hypothetical protein
MKAKFLALALTAMSFLAAGTAQAGVVLSNMGANGLTDTATSGNTNTDILSTNLLAAGFSTGAVAQRLDWVSMVTFNNDVGTKTVEIYTDNAGAPGSLFATSVATTVGSRGVYQFNFSGVDLAASTNYWIRPAVGLSWYIEDNGDAPAAQNGSGFASTGYRRSTDGGSSWLNSGNQYTLGISASDVPPVPEPALTSLLCLGGIAFMRRRKSK